MFSDGPCVAAAAPLRHLGFDALDEGLHAQLLLVIFVQLPLQPLVVLVRLEVEHLQDFVVVDRLHSFVVVTVPVCI